MLDVWISQCLFVLHVVWIELCKAKDRIKLWDIYTGTEYNGTLFCLQADGDQRYEVLNVLGFSSNRRRMSVIVRCPDKRIRLFIKGAVSTVRFVACWECIS